MKPSNISTRTENGAVNAEAATEPGITMVIFQHRTEVLEDENSYFTGSILVT